MTFQLENDISIAENVSLINYILLELTLHTHKSRKKHSLNMHYIITNIRTVKTLEKRMALMSDRKSIIYHKKWNVKKINCQCKK